MKIEIITRHSVPNYGSILQAYAMQKAIEKLGHDAEIIDYTRYEERNYHLANTLIKGKKWEKNGITRSIYKLVQTPNYANMYKRFAKYRKELLKETKQEYGEIEELRNNLPKADIYCSGSDQIWGPIGTVNYDAVYFLEFVKNKKCIAYASSFGRKELNEDLQKNLNAFLAKYSKILVRENSAKEILLKRNIKNVEKVLDPTFLLTKEEWSAIANQTTNKPKKKYILIYQLHANNQLVQYAKQLAKRKNMKLVRISPSFYHVIRSGKFIYLPTPYAFLSYFQHASYILTDSFHATAFSVIFHKKFIDILPRNQTETRIKEILRVCNLENRVLKNYENFNIIEESIDYKKVDDVLQRKREESFNLLKQAIEGKNFNSY